MKQILIAALVILFAAQFCRAAPNDARLSFEFRSVEGTSYDLRIVGRNEKLINDWFRARGDDIWTGEYFAELAPKNSADFTTQDVELFAQTNESYRQRINGTRDNHDGFYTVAGVNGLPDLFVSKIQIASFAFAVKVFVVKDGRLQSVNFQNDTETLRDSRDSDFSPITYLDDGTISVTWHTNVAAVAGTYATVYMLDVKNLILIPAYTKQIWSPR